MIEDRLIDHPRMADREKMFAVDSEEISALFVLPAEFPYDDVVRLGQSLEQAGILVPGYMPPQVGMGSPLAYLYEHRICGAEFLLLPDRNLVSRIAKVAMGEAVDVDRRRAAALMAFAQCLNLNFDPAVAFHELAHREGNQAAHQELRWFRSADEARPQEWVDVALERTERLVPIPFTGSVPEYDLARPLRRWNRNYVLALKVAELELEPTPAVEKVMRLLDWMYSDFIIGGPALQFASLYFAPSAQRKRMLKYLRSPDRARAIEGVKNAAWDITYMSEFVRRVNEEGSDRQRFVLATADRTLARVATSLLHYPDTLDGADALAERLAAWWSSNDARRIADGFSTYVRRLREPTRSTTQSNAPHDYVASLHTAGERRLLEWCPA